MASTSTRPARRWESSSAGTYGRTCVSSRSAAGLGRLAHLGHRPAPDGQGRGPGRRHRRQGLAEHVVELRQQALAGEPGSTGQALLEERLVERRRARSAQQGPVEVEDRRGAGHTRGRYRPSLARSLTGVAHDARPAEVARNLSNRFDRTVISVVLMDFRQLQALIAIADHGSFSAAAAALQTVQSNVSSHVARLERELGVQLVDRHGGQLTEEGLAVVERGRRVAAELEAAVADVAALRHEVVGTARIGMIGTTARWLAPLLLDGMDRAHPKVRLVVGDGTSATLEPLLASGSLDAAIVNLPQSSPELVERPLFDEDLVLVVPSDHPFAERGTAPAHRPGRLRAAPARARHDLPGRDRRGLPGRRHRPAAPGRARRRPADRLAHAAGLRAGHPAGHRRRRGAERLRPGERRRPAPPAGRCGAAPAGPAERAGPAMLETLDAMVAANLDPARAPRPCGLSSEPTRTVGHWARRAAFGRNST